jgi:hypothetical protein
MLVFLLSRTDPLFERRKTIIARSVVEGIADERDCRRKAVLSSAFGNFPFAASHRDGSMIVNNGW